MVICGKTYNGELVIDFYYGYLYNESDRRCCMNSIFDIIGPVMIGPSSSHTAGASRLANMARYIFQEQPARVDMTLYGSFAKTYKGHGTDKALLAGLLGLGADDERIREAYTLASKSHLSYRFIESPIDVGHPNVVRFDMYNADDSHHASVVGRSLGGGRILVTEIDGMAVDITGDEETLIILHNDKPGVIFGVSGVLGQKQINISGMRVFRKNKHEEAVMVITTDSPVDKVSLGEIRNLPNVTDVLMFAKL